MITQNQKIHKKLLYYPSFFNDLSYTIINDLHSRNSIIQQNTFKSMYNIYIDTTYKIEVVRIRYN